MPPKTASPRKLAPKRLVKRGGGNNNSLLYRVSATGAVLLALLTAYLNLDLLSLKSIIEASITSLEPPLSLAYVTPWNKRGYELVLNNPHASFSTVSPVWFSIQAANNESVFEVDGDEQVDTEWIQNVRSASSKLKLLPRFMLDGWKQADFVSFLKGEHDETLADAIVAKVQQYALDGVVLECGVPQYLMQFLTVLSEKLHSQDMSLILVIPPRPRNHRDREHSFSSTHFEALSEYVDAFSLMTYDYSQTSGPNAPIQWMKQEIQALCGNDKTKCRKVLVGLNFYGNVYTGDTVSETVRGEEFQRIMTDYAPDLKWHSVFEENYAKFIDSKGQDNTVWYPTPRSIESRIKLIQSLGCGLAVWELGQGLDEFDPVILSGSRK